jgi:hypothetical protein
LRDLIKARREQGASNATIQRYLTAISAVLSHAQDEGRVERNAALSVNRWRIPERRDASRAGSCGRFFRSPPDDPALPFVYALKPDVIRFVGNEADGRTGEHMT